MVGPVTSKRFNAFAFQPRLSKRRLLFILLQLLFERALKQKLTEQLAGENKELFLRFCNAYAEFMGESELDTFITGFRFGARFMMDTFLSDDAPFESFLEG